MTEDLELSIRKIALDEAIRVSYQVVSSMGTTERRKTPKEIVEIAQLFENYLKSGK